MNESLKSLLALMQVSVTRPKEGARRLLSLPLSRSTLWQALALVVIVSLLLTHLADRLLSEPLDPLLPIFRDEPFLTALILGALTLVTVIAIARIGRLMGGTGDFYGALRSVVWIQAIMLVLQSLQLVFMVILPPVAVLLGPLSFALSLWLMTNFIAVLHGFRALFPVFLMIIVTAVAMGFALFFVLEIAGFGLPMEMPNV